MKNLHLLLKSFLLGKLILSVKPVLNIQILWVKDEIFLFFVHFFTYILHQLFWVPLKTAYVLIVDLVINVSIFWAEKIVLFLTILYVINRAEIHENIFALDRNLGRVIHILTKLYFILDWHDVVARWITLTLVLALSDLIDSYYCFKINHLTFKLSLRFYFERSRP